MLKTAKKMLILRMFLYAALYAQYSKQHLTKALNVPSNARAAVIERKYKMNITFSDLVWNNSIQNAGPFQRFAVVAKLTKGGVLHELNQTFQSEPDFKHISLAGVDPFKPPTQVFWNDEGKVRTSTLLLLFREADKNSRDPWSVLLAHALKDGRLGQLRVEKDTIAIQEIVKDYSFGEWQTISGACSFRCCLMKGSVAQNRSCTAAGSLSCTGILFERSLNCTDLCDCTVERLFEFSILLLTEWKAEQTTQLKKTIVLQMNRTFDKTPEYEGVVEVMLQESKGKVKAEISTKFAQADEDSRDPDVLFRLEVSDGKLGALPVNKESLAVREYIEGYTFSNWTTSAAECSKCCDVGGQVTQTRDCETVANDVCLGVLMTREIGCNDVCNDEQQCSAGTMNNGFLKVVYFTMFLHFGMQFAMSPMAV